MTNAKVYQEFHCDRKLEEHWFSESFDINLSP